MYDLYTGAPDDQMAKVAYFMQLFQYARSQRVNFDTQWEEASAINWPEFRNSFSFGHVRSPGVKYGQFQVDSSASIRAMRFMAIADALLTPFNMCWSMYCHPDPEVMKDRDAKVYYEQVTRTIWNERYRYEANFMAQQQTGWLSMGVLGNMGIIPEENDWRPGTKNPGIRYVACFPGEIYLLVNHQGRIDGFVRHFRWTARQAYQKWGNAIPLVLRAALEKADVFTLFDFLQFVIPRTDYDPMKLFSAQGKPWSSTYVSVTGYSVIEEGGYWEFPLAYGRYSLAPEEWYGRGPGQIALAEMKTKNAEKETFLKQGRLAGDPMWLLPEDGIMDFRAESGAYITGGMSEDGKMMVGTPPVGQHQITKELMEDSDKILDAAFLVDLFPLLFDKSGRQRSARETLEVANQMAIFLAPTLGRQYGDCLGTMCMREYNLLRRMRKLPPPPPVVKEAGGGLHVKYTSPLARALNAQGITGFMRAVEMTATIAQSSGDDSVWDAYDFEVAIPEIVSEMYGPARWMATPKKIAAKQKARQDNAERERQVQELPGKAAIMKAQAISDKASAGQNIGGTLSGTPEGGMPMMPQQPQGQPGQPALAPGMPGQSGQPA